jgi:hypothetical protein
MLRSAQAAQADKNFAWRMIDRCRPRKWWRSLE